MSALTWVPMTPLTVRFSDRNCQFGNTAPNLQHLQVWGCDVLGRADSIHFKNCYFGYAVSIPFRVGTPGNGTVEDCFFDQYSRPRAFNLGNCNTNDYTAQLQFYGTSGPIDPQVGLPGSDRQVLGCSFKPFANDSFATQPPCITAQYGAVNILVSGRVYVPNDSNATVPTGPNTLLFNTDLSGDLATVTCR
jgi:hypothetical protein